MSDTLDKAASNTAPGKKTLDQHLFVGSRGTVDDVRVQTGYPVWNLISQWIGGGFDDNEVFAAYEDMPREEWEAAKQYYLDHKVFIDARILSNTQPAFDDDVPPVRSIEEYFAWMSSRDKGDASSTAQANG